MAGATPALDIVRYLPQKNCGECGEPLCITFASQLLGGKRAPGDCRHLAVEGRTELEQALRPAVRKVAVGNGRGRVEIGEERVLFRHQLRFFHPTAVAVLLNDDLGPEALQAKLARIEALDFTRMGQRLTVDMIAVRSQAGTAEAFSQAVGAAKSGSPLPLVLVATDPVVMGAGLTAAGEPALICSATSDTWVAMAALACEHSSPLAVEAAPDELADLVGKVQAAGVTDVVLAPRVANPGPFSAGIRDFMALRSIAVVDGQLGYPLLAYPVRSATPAEEVTWASALTTKYAGVLLLESDAPEVIYPLLTLRQAVFTDPTVPTTVDPGLYVEGSPDRNAPVLLTGNFAMTYSMLSSDVRSAGVNAFVVVADAQGYSVGVACLLGTITAEQVTELLTTTGVREKVDHNRMVIPGLMASLKAKIEEATGMEVLVGPNDSKHMPRFLEETWPRA